MGKKLKDAPVYYALIQVKFNPILTLDNYAPQIQDALRKQGFPGYQKSIVSTLGFNLIQAAPDFPRQMPIEEQPRYEFNSMDKTKSISLDVQSISFQTSNYDTFETFSAEFLKGLTALNNAIPLDFTDRIGIRYLDAVYPKEGKNLSQYLDSCMQGLFSKIKGEVHHSFSEAAFTVNSVNIIARAISRDGPVVFPPDIASVPISKKFQTLSGPNAILDIDSFKEVREPFNVDSIISHMNNIHAEAKEAFKQIVTPEALEEWEGK